MDVDTQILRKLVRRGWRHESYMWLSFHRFGIETGIHLTDEQEARLAELIDEVADRHEAFARRSG